MLSTFEKISSYLQRNHILFETHEHASAASVDEYQRTMNTRLQQQAKALFVRFKKTNEKGFAIVAIQGQKKADLALICKLLHAREVRLATAEQLYEVTGCRYGELPPLGKLFSVPLLMDKDLLTEEKIYFNAGSLTASIIVSPSEIQRVEEPLFF